MAADGSKCTIAQVFGHGRLVEHGRLHNAGRKNDFVLSGGVVSLIVVILSHFCLSKEITPCRDETSG